MDLTALTPVEILALTIWGEARGEPVEGRLAVGNVVMNRVRWPRWWGRTVHGVCLAPRQFSCWNEGDPNRTKIEALIAARLHGDQAFMECHAEAEAILAEKVADKSGRADHYCTRAAHPKWAEGREPVAEIGGHLFYRLELPDPG